jgi:PKD repeat protein
VKAVGIFLLLNIFITSSSAIMSSYIAHQSDPPLTGGDIIIYPSLPSIPETGYETDPPAGYNNQPPTAFIDCITPSSARPGEPIQFIGHGYDPEGEDIFYNWSSSINGPLNQNASFNTSILNYGRHTISFTVTDYREAVSNPVTAIVIINNPPTAYAGDEGYFGYLNTPITFNGTKSTDADGHIISYSWSFGDSTTGTGATTTHTYATPGTYNVTLTVTDDLGGTDTATTTATIVGTSPIAHTGGPYYGIVNQTIIINGSKSSDLDGHITTWHWHFGDNTQANGTTTNHTYHTTGVYTITLTVTDNNGNTGVDTTLAIITLFNTPPSPPRFDITGYRDHNTTVTFSLVSTDPDNDNLHYLITWDDNNTTTTPVFPSGTILSLSHTWTTTGLFDVHVVAIDEHNNTSPPTNQTINITTTPTRSDSSPSTYSLHHTPLNPVSLFIITMATALLIISILLLARKRKHQRNKTVPK